MKRITSSTHGTGSERQSDYEDKSSTQRSYEDKSSTQRSYEDKSSTQRSYEDKSSTTIKAPTISNEWSNKFILKFDPDFKFEFNPDNVKYDSVSPRPSQTLVETNKYKHLVENKNQIDQFKIRDKMYLWSRWSKIVNPYEKIANFSTLESVTISRAFFKLYEILYYCEIQDIKTSLHICEAPGGFISATKHIFKNVDWYAQTLYEGGGSLKIDEGLDPNRWVKNGNGNLYKLENIISLENKVPKAELITADGGFDVSHDPNNQEQLSSKLIYGEILTALHCQAKGGTFVCKIFESMTRPTYQQLLLLKKYYSSVLLIKPRTSRYTNSEKYIVCKGFLGIDPKELEQFDAILTNWNQDYCRDFGIESKNFKFKEFKTYNTFIAVNQSWYIHQAVQHARNNNKTISNNLETMQNKKALVFCLAFELKKDEEMCEHQNLKKMEERSNMKYLFKCENCLQLLVKV